MRGVQPKSQAGRSDDAKNNAESEFAPTYTVPPSPTLLTGIEYPGPVKSVPRALNTLGGPQHVSKALSGAHPNLALELKLNPENRFGHPVPAHIGRSANVLLEVVRRRRKHPRLDSDWRPVEEGVFSVKVAGIVAQTVRFRAMADFQYLSTSADPMVNLTEGMRSLDPDTIKNFEFPAPHENFDSELYLPPPVFSRHEIPTVYDFKNVGQATEKTTIVDGVEQTRMVNVSRFQARRVKAISSADSEVPQAGEYGDGEEGEITSDRALLASIDALLQERPVWTRSALSNRLAQDGKGGNDQATKKAVPIKAYTFTDGAFKDLLIRFGYDPRKDPKARMYQHIVLRNLQNTRTKRSGVTTGVRKANSVLAAEPGSREASTVGVDGVEPNAKSISRTLRPAPSTQQFQDHVFDGETLHAPVGNYQLIDITDPLIRSLIDSEAGVLPSFTSASLLSTPAASGSSPNGEGWWDSDYFEQIRQLVRRKFNGLRDGNRVTDLECSDLLGDPKLLFGGAGNKTGTRTNQNKVDQSEDGSDTRIRGKRRSLSFKGRRRSLGNQSLSDGSDGGAHEDMDESRDDDDDEGEGDEEANDANSDDRTTTHEPVDVRRLSVLTAKTTLKNIPKRRSAWESRKKRAVLAKRRDSNETEEQRAERLRKSIGLGANEREADSDENMEE